jgi:hypothetical protein
MYPTAPAYRAKPPSQGTAETLALIAWIFQVISSLVFIALGALVVYGGTILGFAFSDVGIFLWAIAFLALVVPILMLYVGFVYSYRRIRDGNLAGARAPTLLLGVLGLFFGGLIVGILYLVAYVKVGDAENETRTWGYPSGSGPYGSAPGYPGPYSGTPWMATGPAPYLPPGSVAYQPPPAAAAVPMNCPRCGRPATYIPQYGRSYCYPCAQYA